MLSIFGVIRNGLVSGTFPGDVQTIYCSASITQAVLIVGVNSFVTTNIHECNVSDLDLFRITFFNLELSLPLGNLLGNITIQVTGAPDGAVILFA